MFYKMRAVFINRLSYFTQRIHLRLQQIPKGASRQSYRAMTPRNKILSRPSVEQHAAHLATPHARVQVHRAAPCAICALQQLA